MHVSIHMLDARFASAQAAPSGFFIARPERVFLRLEFWMNKDKIALVAAVLNLMTAVINFGKTIIALVKALPF